MERAIHPMFAPLRMPGGHVLRNRLMLAPLTTQQSGDDGSVSRADREWLAMRAQGGFGLVVSAAAAVSVEGRAFPGQYGTWSEAFLPGLAGLAEAVNRHEAVGLVQLQHGGGRSLRTGTGAPLAPSATASARAADADDLALVVEAFASGAERSVRAGFAGVQVHAAYGFLLAQFLDPEANRRSDAYGGSLDNRARLLREVLAAIRTRVPAALLSVRLNLRDRGVQPEESLALAGELLVDGSVDHLDLVVEDPTAGEEATADRLAWLGRLPRKRGVLGLTGGFSSARAIEAALDGGADLVGIGTAAVLHPDLPRRWRADPAFPARTLPVPAAYLAERGVSPPFLAYLSRWPGFIADANRAAA
jgi:2,4-dienoyl-CoA reductase-like NADH-dependent reductase (Old Yellow Enzyme family)